MNRMKRILITAIVAIVAIGAFNVKPAHATAYVWSFFDDFEAVKAGTR